MVASTLPPTVVPPLYPPILPSSGSRAGHLGCPFPPPSPLHAITDAPRLEVPHAEHLPSHHVCPLSLKLSHHPPSPPFIAFKPFTFFGPWQCLTCRGLTPTPPAVATPNSVLSEEAFKGLGVFFALDSGDEEEDVSKEVVGEGRSGAKNNLVITNLGLLQPLVDSLFKCGITHLFLIQEPDLLLLDEPINHLDLDTIERLEGYLQKQNMPMIIISHD